MCCRLSRLLVNFCFRANIHVARISYGNTSRPYSSENIIHLSLDFRFYYSFSFGSYNIIYYYRKKRFRWHNVKRLQEHLTNTKQNSTSATQQNEQSIYQIQMLSILNRHILMGHCLYSDVWMHETRLGSLTLHCCFGTISFTLAP